jgi:hypothetical protein
MENIIDLVATDASANDISDKIKDILYSKASEKIEAIRPEVASSVFDEKPDPEPEVNQEEPTEEQ